MDFLLLRASRSELGWVMGFELGLSVGVVMVDLLDLHLDIQLTCCLACHLSITLTHRKHIWLDLQVCTLAGLIIGTVERYLVGLSLGISLGYPLEYLNLGYFLSVTLMGAPLWLWFVSEAERCQCCFCRLTDFRKSTCWAGGGVYLFIASLPL